MFRIPGVFAVLIICSSPATAADNCRRVYENGVRNISVDASNTTLLVSIFDEHCEENGNLRTSVTDTKAELVIKQVPVKFWGSHQGARQRFQNFCKTYRDDRFSQTTQISFRNEVVTEALKLFNQCEALYAQGVQIAHYENVSDVVVDFVIRRGIDFEIQGVNANNAECGVTTGDGPRKLLGVGTAYRPPPASNVGMICVRTGQQQPNSLIYEPATITIATNFGPYTISLFKEEIWGPPLATVHAREFDKVSRERDSKTAEASRLGTDLKAANDRMENRLANLGLQTHLFHIGEFAQPNAGRHFGCYTSAEAVRDAMCGPGVRFLNSQYRNHSGNQCGYSYQTMACVKIPP